MLPNLENYGYYKELVQSGYQTIYTNDITNDNIVAGINEVTPVFKTSKAEIENMRSYAKKNHIPYTSYQESEIQNQEINKDDNIGDKNEGSFLDNCLFDM